MQDPLGHCLLKDRISKCPEIIHKMLETPIRAKMLELSKHFTVTGIGSSEAHGRFFTDLINRYTSSTATFLNLSNFYAIQSKKDKDRESVLVIFSQGISPNSLLAINQRRLFKRIILFTSTTTAGAKTSHAELVKTLKAEGNMVIQFPFENEYTLLMRVIGPLTGYLAVIQFINQNWHKCIPPCSNSDITLSIVEAGKNIIKNDINVLRSLKKGSILLTPAPLCEYAQNLAYKFLEGLFVPMPAIVDYLSFGHGTFQQLVTEPRPIVIFKENTVESQLLYSRAKPMIEATQSKPIEITSNLPSPWNIFEYEAKLNYLVLDGIERGSINQIEWPGKNLDQGLYNIREPRS